MVIGIWNLSTICLHFYYYFQITMLYLVLRNVSNECMIAEYCKNSKHGLIKWLIIFLWVSPDDLNKTLSDSRNIFIYFLINLIINLRNKKKRFDMNTK